jgi:hypothetical protein
MMLTKNAGQEWSKHRSRPRNRPKERRAIKKFRWMFLVASMACLAKPGIFTAF